ncbi:hypothetical protein ACQ4PT_043131 [Festuca glaucescens]
MEPAPTSSSFLVAHLGEGAAPSGWARQAFQQTLIFLLACAFAWGLHRAGFDLGFAVPTTYALGVLCFCLWKLELLRRDQGGDQAAAARERRRVGLAAWAMSLAWGSNVALQVVSVASSQALRVVLWVLAGITMGLAIYFLFAARRSDASADDGGHWPLKDLHELSPEQRV